MPSHTRLSLHCAAKHIINKIIDFDLLKVGKFHFSACWHSYRAEYSVHTLIQGYLVYHPGCILTCLPCR